MEIPDIDFAKLAAAGITMTLVLLSVPPLFMESQVNPPETHPLRAIDLPGLHNFFDHSGNFINGYGTALPIVLVGSYICKHVSEEKRPPVVIATTLAATAGSVGLNLAYESGMTIPAYVSKLSDTELDKPDALYGSFAGTLLALSFCATAFAKTLLRHRNKRS